MSQSAKTKAASPRIKQGTPDTSFAASPFAKSMGTPSSPFKTGTPSSPFKASLNAFPALPEEDEYAGFDDTWNPSKNYGLNAHAGPSGTSGGHQRSASASSRLRTPSMSSRHESSSGVDDLEDFFERGNLNDLDNYVSTVSDRSRTFSQEANRTARPSLQNTSRSEQLASLGRLPPQRQRSTSLSYIDSSHPTAARAAFNIQLHTPQTTEEATPSTYLAETPDMVFRRNQFQQSPATTTTTDSALISPDLSESMLRPLPMGRSLSGWRAPVAAPVDYSARLRAYSESIAEKRKNLAELKSLYQREKQEIRASPPVPPYAVRKAFHNKEETERKLVQQREEKEKKILFQRTKAEADAAAAERRRVGDAEFAKLKAAQQAAVEAALKREAEIRAKPAADAKAAEEKKKADEKAAKEKHNAQVKAVMDAAAAASSAMTYQDQMNIAAYYTHLQNGGPMIPEYEELLKKFYAGGGSPAAGLMQYMEDLHSSEIASAQLAELQKIKAKQDEELAQAQAARLAAEQAKQQADAAAASPGQRLFNTPPHSPFHPGLSPRPSPRPPNMSADGSASPGARSPFPMAALVDRVLKQVCEKEEEDRLHAIESMLQTGQRIERSRAIGVSKDYSPALGDTENSRLQLYASIYPFREYAGNTVSTRADSGDALIARMSHPKVAGILFEQLKNVLCHLRVVASQYGASEVTHIRYVLTKEDTTGMVIPGARVGKISAIIVQQVQETPTGPIRTQPMDENKPCREYAQYTLPERLNSPPIVYEILIERPT